MTSRALEIPSHVAVVLNDNARFVTRRTIARIARLIPKTNLYYSRTKEEAYAYVRDIVERRIPWVFSGGGDGSITQLINLFRRFVNERNVDMARLGDSPRQAERYEVPRFGILKMGTGNGWASMLGVRRGLNHLERFLRRDGEEQPRTTKVRLIESEGYCFPFSGLGWDAAILNDFVALKRRLARISFTPRLLNGLIGYLLTIFGYTAPREMMRRQQPEVEIVNTGERVLAVSASHPPRALDVPRGAVLYRGPVNAVGVATTTNYGFGLKAFPFARMHRDLMQLRVVKAGVLELISHARPIWTGCWESRNLEDYLVESVRMVFDREMPLQRSGDAEGVRRVVEYRMSDTEVEMLGPCTA